MDEANENIINGDEMQQTNADAMNDENDLVHFRKLLLYLQDEFDHAGAIPLYKKKQMVNVEMCQTIIRDIYDNLPRAVAYGNKLYDERDRIMKNAENAAVNHVTAAEAKARSIIESAEQEALQVRAEAEKYAADLVANAEEHAAKLVDENEITARAREEGRQIVGDARSDAKELRQKATQDCFAMIDRMQSYAQGVVEGLARQKNSFIQYNEPDNQ